MLGMIFTNDGLKTIQYVAITVAQKKDKSKTITGLFMGFQPLVQAHTTLVGKDEMFIWIMKGDHCHMLYADYYEVDTLEIGHGTGAISINRLTTSATNTHNIHRMEAICAAMKDQKKVTEDGLIDIRAYKGMSQTLIRQIEKDESGVYSSSANSTRQTTCGYNSGARASIDTATTHTRAVYKKKEVSTSIINRTTKYSVSNALAKMAEKINQIQLGNYELPKLPEIPADKEEEEKKEAKKLEKENKENSSGDEKPAETQDGEIGGSYPYGSDELMHCGIS